MLMNKINVACPPSYQVFAVMVDLRLDLRTSCTGSFLLFWTSSIPATHWLLEVISERTFASVR